MYLENISKYQGKTTL